MAEKIALISSGAIEADDTMSMRALLTYDAL
jgi:hypothetical protein